MTKNPASVSYIFFSKTFLLAHLFRAALYGLKLVFNAKCAVTLLKTTLFDKMTT
jgi:hypothetical protein